MYANNERLRIKRQIAYQDLKDLAKRKIGDQEYQKCIIGSIAGEGVKFDVRIHELVEVIKYLDARYFMLLER